jgi:hypothetical protein
LADLALLARSEIGADRVAITRHLDLERLSPSDALLVVHPQGHLDVGELEAFMRAGGRVALFDDYGSGSELLAHFGIRRLPLPAVPSRMLRGNPALAVAESASRPEALPEALRDLSGDTPVVMNHATGLGDANLLPLLVVRGGRDVPGLAGARSEPGRHVPGFAGAWSEPEGEGDVLVAVAGVVGRGRFLAVGDSSVAMNAMLRFPGNRSLATSVVRYLAGEDKAASDQGKLYIFANDAVMTGEFGTPSLLPKAARVAAVGTLDALRQGLSPGLSYFAAVVVGLGVIGWASIRAGRTYKATVPRFARPVPIAAQGGLAGLVASLTEPAASPARVVLELRRAIEEQVAVRLGLDRPAPYGELVARVRARGMLAASDADALAALLARLSRLESRTRAFGRVWGLLGYGKRAEIAALLDRARRLLTAMDGASQASPGRGRGLAVET